MERLNAAMVSYEARLRKCLTDLDATKKLLDWARRESKREQGTGALQFAHEQAKRRMQAESATHAKLELEGRELDREYRAIDEALRRIGVWYETEGDG